MTYKQSFYSNRHENTVYAAEKIIQILTDYIKPKSVVDVGCGTGTFLSVFHKNGVTDITGIDGDWIDRKLIEIPRKKFMPHDLTIDLHLPRRFDLAMSLEVAEHLTDGEKFANLLTLLSDDILFSAAIPFQGGNNHVNEQWQSYWVEQFNKRGYHVYDFIRPIIWDDDQIPYWYRQNILFYSKSVYENPVIIPNIVHPDAYLTQTALRIFK